MARFFGIDGCKSGWFYAGLGKGDDDFCFGVCSTISAVFDEIKEDAKIALIDIPIGLTESPDGRRCDREARQKLGKRHVCVFTPPCRAALRGINEEEKKRINKEKTGKSLSKQSLGILPKIAEVDSFLRGNKTANRILRETHPEVCFWALNGGKVICESKNTPTGKERRLRILEKQFPAMRRFLDCVHKRHSNRCGDDDIIDALAAAMTARIGFGRFMALPKKTELDDAGLRMAMAFYLDDR
jgi:predicted RNase H-like nuclease